MKLQIESRVLGDIAQNHIIPTAIKYQNRIIENITGIKEIYGKDALKMSTTQRQILADISEHMNAIKLNCDKMLEERKKANKLEHSEKMAITYCNKVKPYFAEIKYHSDKLELLVDDELWPLPKLRELLFTR